MRAGKGTRFVGAALQVDLEGAVRLDVRLARLLLGNEPLSSDERMTSRSLTACATMEASTLHALVGVH